MIDAKVNGKFSILCFSKMQNFNSGENLYPSLLGVRKVVKVQGIFCSHIAPGKAVAAVNARSLLDPNVIWAVDRKVHCYVQ